VQAYRNRAQQRIQKHYDWETVVDQYEQLFARMCGQDISAQRMAVEADEARKVMKAVP
jgi:hypothetical protein